MDRNKLGQALIKNGKLKKEHLQMALTLHDRIGGDFAPLLVKLGYAKDEDITVTIGQLEGIETVDITTLVIPKKLVQSIPRDVIEKHNVIPISRKENQITLAMSNVHDYAAIEEIQFLTSCKIEPVLASRDAIRKAIAQFYYDSHEKPEEKPETIVTSEVPIEKMIEEQPLVFQKALIHLLIEKNIIAKADLLNLVKEPTQQ